MDRIQNIAKNCFGGAVVKVTTLDIFSKHFSFSGWIVCGGESENAVQQVTTAGDGVCVFEASSAYSTKE